MSVSSRCNASTNINRRADETEDIHMLSWTSSQNNGKNNQILTGIYQYNNESAPQSPLKGDGIQINEDGSGKAAH